MGAVKGLFHRKYEQIYAVKDVSFTVNEGEFVGFLGPNGAGKTTTLKMLAGLVSPSTGSVSVLGFKPEDRDDRYRRQFSLLLGQKNQLWWDLPASESFELNSRIYGLSRSAFHRTLDELTELLQVRDRLGVMVRELSLGERMKMEIIAALLHQPKVLFLDEPTIGLDVVSQKIVREFLKNYNQLYRTTVLLTSHYMSDIEALCRRVIIIDQGRIFFDGSLDEVVARFADFKFITIHLDGSDTLPVLALSQFGKVVEYGFAKIRIRVQRNKVISTCKALLESLPVQDLDIEEVPVEDIIGNIFTKGDAEPDKAAA
jgi:ABC-2 type transport system ATP-binding protein